MSPIEIAANLLATLSILLAARNSVHSWWTGIVGCGLFGIVFFDARLYADVTLQLFFIGASIYGWWLWLRGDSGAPLPIRQAPVPMLVRMSGIGLVVALGYGLLLYRFTNAYAPFFDSAVLTLSVIGQLLLMRRMIETWVFWLVVDTIAVPLYAVRDLHITACLYAVYWLNAFYGAWTWHRIRRREAAALAA
jgi:nicotinamide mononucleotide transporter